MNFLRRLSIALLLSAGVASIASATTPFTVRMPVVNASYVAQSTAFDFGTLIVGATPQNTFTFTNNGSTATTMGAVQASGNAIIYSQGCTGVLQPGDTCSMVLGVLGSAVGTVSGSVSVSHSASPVPDLYNLTATVVTSAAVLRFDEPQVQFGPQPLRQPTADVPMTLRNTGSTPASITSVDITYGAMNFSIDTNDCERILAPADSCQVGVSFSPQTLGQATANMTFTLEDGTVVRAATLSGTGVQGVATWSASQLNFVGIAAGQTSAPQPLTLTNTGGGPLGITALDIADSSDAGYFQIVSTSCFAQLLPGATCTINLTFSPTDTLARSAQLQLVATDTAPSISHVSLFAQPILLQPVLSVTPMSLTFGSLPVGTPGTQSLTLQSTGTQSVTVTAYSLSGSSSDFSIQNASTCTGSLDPGMQCVLTVQAKPSVTGLRTGSLAIASNSVVPVLSIPLTTTGLQGTLQATPSVLSFGTTQVGKSSGLPLVLTNTGNAPVTVSSLAPSGAQASSFAADSSCTGVTLSANATCTLNVSYTPTAAGNQTAALNVVNNGATPTVAVPLAGASIAAPISIAALSDFTCPTPAQVSTAVVCTATLSNPGTVAFTFSGAGTSSVSGFVPTISGCTSPLQPNQSCTVSLSAVPQTPGAYNTTYQLTTSAQTLSKAVLVNVEAPHAQLNMTPHGTVMLGTNNAVSHTLINTGNFPVYLPLAPTIAQGSSNVFSIANNTCPTSLAVGASCNIVTRCQPTTADTFQATLSMSSNALPAISGTLSCAGQALPAANNAWQLTPATFNFGGVQVGGATSPVPFVIQNVSPAKTAPMTLTNLVLGGSNATDFSIDQTQLPACLRSYSPGSQCTVWVTAKPSQMGPRTANLQLMATGSGAAPAFNFSVTGQGASFVVSPTTLDFGTVSAGSATVTKTFTITNTGTYAGTASVVVNAGSSAAFTVPVTCNQVSVNPSGSPSSSCAGQVSLSSVNTASLRGLQQGSLTVSFSNKQPSQTVSYQVQLSQPASPAGSVSLSCPAASYVGAAVYCTVRVTSTGTAPLNVTALTPMIMPGSLQSNSTGASCSAPGGPNWSAIPPGQYCSMSLYHTFTSVGAYTLNINTTVAPGVGLAPASANIQVVAPSLSLATSDAAATQIGSRSTATQVLTNTGQGPVTINTLTSSNPSVVGISSNTCSTLGSGQSCNIVTTCTPASATAVKATLTVTASYGATVSGQTVCSGVAPQVTASYQGPVLLTAGGYSTSGNWVAITNSGVGPVSLTAMMPAAGWSLYSNPAAASNCAVGKTLAAGSYCLLMEVLNGTQAPGLTVTGNQVVKTSLVNVAWASSPVQTKGLRFTLVKDFGIVQVGDNATATYTVTNDAPVASSAINFTLTGAGLSLSGNTCAAGLAPGGSCSLTLNYAAGLVPTVFAGSAAANTGYNALLAGVAQPGTARTAVQGTLPLGFSVIAANVTLTAGTNSPIAVGQTATITSVLLNAGASPITTTTAPKLSGSQSSITGGTCVVGYVVAPGSSCTILALFAPTSSTQTASTIQIGTTVGARTATFTGQVIAQTDVSVSLTGAATALTNGQVTYSLGVSNSVRGPAQVNLSLGATNNGSNAYLSQFTGGACGNVTFNAAGAVLTQTTPPSSSSGVSCVPNIVNGQLQLSIPAYNSYSAALTYNTGNALGKVQVSASAVVSQVTDTNQANNSASVSTTVSNPLADIAVQVSASAASMAPNTSGQVTITAQNTSTGAQAGTSAVSATVAVTSVSTSGGAMLNLGALTCTAKTAGATCDGAGNVTLPPGSYVTYTGPATSASATGVSTVTATVTTTSAGFTDNNPANNTSSYPVSIAQVPTPKRCMFTAAKTISEPFIGPYSGNGASCGLGFNTTLIYSDWMLPFLADGAKSMTEYMGCLGKNVNYQNYDLSSLTWKGSSAPMTPIILKSNGNSYAYPYVPIAQVFSQGQWEDDPWAWFARNGQNGPFPSTLFYCSTNSQSGCGSPGRVGHVVRADGAGMGPQSSYWSADGSSSTGTFVSWGQAIDGSMWRQTWIENSPGPNCAAPGTALVTGTITYAPAYSNFSTTN